jgi:methionine-rich copper-binding protein CopC
MSAPSRGLVPVLAALWLVLAVAVPALAHADLASSDPADKSVLATPPTVITLTFTEGLDQGKSSFKLSGPDGASGTGQAAKGGSKVMTLDGLDLGPGAYAIKWTSVATDGHIARGTLSFTVSEPTPAPATPAPAPTGAPTDAASAAPTDIPTTAPLTTEPSVSAAAASALPATTPGAGTDPTAGSGSGSDVLIPIVVGLALVAGIGAFLLRRSRGA